MNPTDSSSDAEIDSAELLPQVYEELRRLAQVRVNNEAPQTLSATALVHEAYLRVSSGEDSPRWKNKRHFFAAAAEAMRRILIDRARAKNRIKHGGELEKAEFSESQIIAPVTESEILDVDDALSEFERVDPESAELVKMHYFAGLSWVEIAEATGISERTLRRRWTYAKAWLRDRIDRDRNE